MNSKKRSFQESNSGGDQNKKQRNKLSDWKRYSAKDKSRWPELQQMINNIKLNSNEIGYLLDPAAIAEIKTSPATPAYAHFKPSLAKPTETDEEKEARDLTNDVLKSMYKESLSTKVRARAQGYAKALRKIFSNHFRRSSR